jgi:predicted negative regulator of RcsB-dependent stress response
MDSEWLRDLGVWVVFGLTLAVLRFLAWQEGRAKKQQQSRHSPARGRALPRPPK